jgi:Mlc titration factor MtfA (ptsG expression regulator)
MYDWRIIVLLVLALMLLAYNRMKKSRRVYRRLPDRPFPNQWREILKRRVPFYQNLRSLEKTKFEEAIHIFLLNYKIVGEGTQVTDLDRILVAAGGVIPTFRLEKWHYLKLDTVVIYPNKFQIPETEQMARGLVGWGEMEGQMWLSRKALYQGFHDQTDNKNVAIHEFIHLMDMQDGMVDGVLEGLMAEEDIDNWQNLFEEKATLIASHDNASIRRYAKTSPVEFLAATGEHYFENPDDLRRGHPRVYEVLDKIFNPNKNWF